MAEDVGAGLEESVQLSDVRKPSKLELKRQQQYEERRRRAINKGVSPDTVDAYLAAEDYRDMPVDKKIERLERMITGLTQQVMQDIGALRHNDGVIAEAMDINLKAMARCLEKAGVTLEEQGRIIQEVNEEVTRERQAQAQAISQAQTQKIELADVEKALHQAETGLVGDDDSTHVGAPPPPEATVFGGEQP